LTNRDFEGAKKAIGKSCEGIEFGAVKLIWDEKCTSVDIWNEKIIKELQKLFSKQLEVILEQVLITIKL
jgi:hypothetical protein